MRPPDFKRTIRTNGLPFLLMAATLGALTFGVVNHYSTIRPVTTQANNDHGQEEPAPVWRGRDESLIPADTDSGTLVSYGRSLIANTASYLGPKGKILQITNGMNCQNCHLAAGTLPFANNYGKVYATYPKFRARNNGLQTINDRINDCLERSLNGSRLDSNLHEMRAMKAYLQWIGNDVPRGVEQPGTSLMKLPDLGRAANPKLGKIVYQTYCQTCHGKEGTGQVNIETNGYVYPPLWGKYSYNDGAGMYRISTLASFVRNNMPFGTDYQAPKLSIEEAWDVAAFINSQPRPHKDQRADWAKLSTKPIDFPFGPYADSFSEQQHKYGPFGPIRQTLKANTTKQ